VHHTNFCDKFSQSGVVAITTWLVESVASVVMQSDNYPTLIWRFVVNNDIIITLSSGFFFKNPIQNSIFLFFFVFFVFFFLV